MNNRIIILILLILVAGAYFFGQWLRSTDDDTRAGAEASMDYAPCDPVAEDCRLSINGDTLVFAFRQAPSAMQPFTVSVYSDAFEPESVSLAFTMPGMDMGENRYRLEQVSPGQWQARVVLPMCSMGRSDWVAHLRVRGAARSWQADFPFRVERNESANERE